MRRWCNSKYILCMILLTFLLPPIKLEAQTDQKKEEKFRILFISSYSYSWRSIPYQVDGLIDSLDPKDYTIHYEFMDIKNTIYSDSYGEFYEFLKMKIDQREPYDGIVIGDDAALQFIMTYKDELFPDKPIVFQGVDHIEVGMSLAEDPLITGVVERVDYAANLELASSLFPQATNLVLIYDQSESGIGIAHQLEEISGLFKDYEVEHLNTSFYTKEALTNKLAEYGEESIIFGVSMGEQKGGILYTEAEQRELIDNYAKVPVFSVTQAGVGNGMFGGYIIDHYAASYLAGEMMVSILRNHEFPAVEIDTPSLYIFDYPVKKKFDIKASKLPQDAKIINQPERFLKKYASWIIISLSVGLLLVIVINYMRGQSRRKLQATYDQLVVTEADLQEQYKRNQKHNEALVEQEAHIRYQAEHDYLTDLPNRRVIIEELLTLVENEAFFAVIVLDFDDFKEINDTYGHECGDLVLREIARRFSELSKEENVVVSRYGGDEFLFIIHEENREAIKRIILKIEKAFEVPLVCNEFEGYVEMSMGIAYSKDSTEIVSDVVSNAALALYEAKKMGKNRHLFYDATMREKFEEKNRIKSKLSEACEEDGFYLLYQPQIDVATGEIHGYEALLRLKNHAISPAQFIPVAEESDLILKIGRIVTKKVIEQLVVWRENGHPLRPVAINFCTRQVQDKGYIEYLKTLLETHSISPELVEIELTESVFLDNNQQAEDLFSDFEALGIQLALDDFGTGYSSISYLTYIPVQKVKLDKSFVDIYLQNEKDVFIENITRLLHNLDLKVTVEGVEKKYQYERLKTFGCDYIQGYYFSKPITGEEVETFTPEFNEV